MFTRTSFVQWHKKIFNCYSPNGVKLDIILRIFMFFFYWPTRSGPLWMMSILFFALSNEMVCSRIVSWMWLLVVGYASLQSHSGNMSDRPFLMGWIVYGDCLIIFPFLWYEMMDMRWILSECNVNVAFCCTSRFLALFCLLNMDVTNSCSSILKINMRCVFLRNVSLLLMRWMLKSHYVDTSWEAFCLNGGWI